MRIEIVTVDGPRQEQVGNNTFERLEVAYKDSTGKVQGKKLVNFKNQAVFEALSSAKRGDFFEVKAEKDGKYWNWTAISPAVAGPVVAVAGGGGGAGGHGGRVMGSNYPSAEERSWTQTRIGRQACLNTAVAIAASDGVTSENVLSIAEQLELWVNRSKAVDGIKSMEDDIPV